MIVLVLQKVTPVWDEDKDAYEYRDEGPIIVGFGPGCTIEVDDEGCTMVRSGGYAYWVRDGIEEIHDSMRELAGNVVAISD